jgi:ABC-type sulfate transport system substrate-binding protein
MLKLLESIGLLMPSRLQNNSSVPVAYFRAIDDAVHLYFNAVSDASIIYDRTKLVATALQSTLPALSAALLQ